MNETIKQIRFMPDDEIYDIQANPTRTATSETSSNVIELFDSADAPLVKCTTSIVGSQNLHGYDKPWVGGAGKNKLEVTGTSATVSGVTFTVNDDGTIVANGTAESHIIWTFGSVSSLSNDTNYILSGVSGGASNTYRMDIRTNTAGVNATLTDGEVTFTKNANMAIVTIRIESGYTINNVKFLPMIRLATVTDSTFAPYSNICPITAYTEGEIEVSDGGGNTTTHTTTYPSAIYRGSEDVVNGTETHDMVVVDLGTINWGKQTANFLGTIPGIKRPSTGSELLNAVCSHYAITPQSSQIANTISGLTWTDGIAFWNTDIQTVEELKALMSGVMLAYELATPTTSSVTPTNLPIKSLNGYNHIESTTGDMEVEYITDGYQAIVDMCNPGLANGILYSFSAIGNALQLGKITGTIFGYIDILTHVTSSTVGDTHEAYLFSLNVDEFISSTGTTPSTEYPVETAQLIHTGQESGLIFVAYYDQSNNIYLKPVSMPGHEQTIKHISLYLSNPHVVTV